MASGNYSYITGYVMAESFIKDQQNKGRELMPNTCIQSSNFFLFPIFFFKIKMKYYTILKLK